MIEPLMNAAANRARGEVDIMLDGTPHVLRPTFEAAQAIEQATGRSLIDLARAADDGSLSLSAMAIVVAEGVRAWGRDINKPSIAGVNARRIGELIYADGILRTIPRVALFLSAAVTGGYKPGDDAQDDDGDDGEGEPKAAAPNAAAG